MRCWLYSHDSVGLGSLRRQLAIAAAVEELAPSARILLATCLDEALHFPAPPNCEILKLPSLQDEPARAVRLQEIARTFRPDVMLVDKHPFGIGDELSTPIEKVKQAGGRIILGLRDILDDHETVREQWLSSDIQQRIARYYDQILIYGSASIFDAVAEYQFSPPLRECTKYCGYVVSKAWQGGQSTWENANGDGPWVVGSAGGGRDGFGLLKAFIEASNGETWRSIVVAGPFMEVQDRQALDRAAQKNGVWYSQFDSTLSTLFSQANVAVCMGGYNTLMEALSCGTSVICVPRTQPRSEQILRATLFERLGLLRMIPQDVLTADALGAEVNKMLRKSRPNVLARVNSLLQFDGANQAARYILG